MFPAEALPAVWMEDQFKHWDERYANERALKRENEAKLAQARAQAEAVAVNSSFKTIDTMPSPSATSAFFGWFAPMLARSDNRQPSFSLASSMWKSPNMGAASTWASAIPTRVSSPVNDAGAKANSA